MIETPTSYRIPLAATSVLALAVTGRLPAGRTVIVAEYGQPEKNAPFPSTHVSVWEESGMVKVAANDRLHLHLLDRVITEEGIR